MKQKWKTDAKQIVIFNKIVRYTEITDNPELLSVIDTYERVNEILLPIKLKIEQAIEKCHHTVKSREGFTKKQKEGVEYWGYGWCRKCGVETGWYCPKSSKHICNYEKSDYCKHCGHPSERK